MEIRDISIQDIIPAPYNPREISPKALEGLRASLEEFGLVEPLIWNQRTKHLVGGHQRLKALQMSGKLQDTVKVVVVDLDLEQEMKLNVTLNNQLISGQWNIQKLEQVISSIPVPTDIAKLRIAELKQVAKTLNKAVIPQNQENKNSSFDLGKLEEMWRCPVMSFDIHPRPCPYQCRYCISYVYRNNTKCAPGKIYNWSSIKKRIDDAHSKGIVLQIGKINECLIPVKEILSLAENVISYTTQNRIPMVINTKNPGAILKFKGIENKKYLHIRTTISCLDKIAEIIEPGAPTPSQRLEASRNLVSEGYSVSINMSPFIPEIISVNEALEVMEKSGCKTATVQIPRFYMGAEKNAQDLERAVGMPIKSLIAKYCPSEKNYPGNIWYLPDASEVRKYWSPYREAFEKQGYVLNPAGSMAMLLFPDWVKFLFCCYHPNWQGLTFGNLQHKLTTVLYEKSWHTYLVKPLVETTDEDAFNQILSLVIALNDRYQVNYDAILEMDAKKSSL